MDNLEIVILAGGKGKRMQSDVPKPLQEVGGVAAIRRIGAVARTLCRRPVIVIGPHSTKIEEMLGKDFRYVLQEEQQGTGHAVLVASEASEDFRSAKTVIVLPGDHPLISEETLKGLYEAHMARKAMITITTLVVPDFEGDLECFLTGGRIKRGADGNVESIVEFKDATEKERAIKEINVSYYCFDAEWLRKNIRNLENANVAKELYLTDMVKFATEQGIPVNSYRVGNFWEAMGFNTPSELANLQKHASNSRLQPE